MAGIKQKLFLSSPDCGLAGIGTSCNPPYNRVNPN